MWGAPQKIMYLADDAFRNSGVRSKSNLIFASGQGSLFAVEKYRRTLEQVVVRKEIDLRLKRNLIAINADQKEAVFENLETRATESIRYDMIHVTPPMGRRISSRRAKSPTLRDGLMSINLHCSTLSSRTFSRLAIAVAYRPRKQGQRSASKHQYW